MDRPVEVLVVSPPSTVWGAQLYLLGQVDALRARGITLTLASPADSPFARRWVDEGHPLVDLPLRLHDGLRRAGSTRRPGPVSLMRSASGVLGGVRSIARVARRFDMLHSYALRSHVETATAGRIVRRPVALDLVDTVRPGLGRRALRIAGRMSSLVVANSRATASAVASLPNVQVIHPAIDLDRFGPGPGDPALHRELSGGVERPLIAVIGRLDTMKGLEYLIEAVSRLGGDLGRARLVVVGDSGTDPPEYAEGLRHRARELLGERVLFVGRRDDIADLLRVVDLLVVASISEPFGLTALEAQATGVPVIGTDAGGLPEFVVHEETGLLVPPRSADGLAEAISRLLGDAELRERLVAEARRRADPARGLEAQYDELAAMYRRVAFSGVDHG